MLTPDLNLCAWIIALNIRARACGYTSSSALESASSASSCSCMRRNAPRHLKPRPSSRSSARSASATPCQEGLNPRIRV